MKKRIMKTIKEFDFFCVDLGFKIKDEDEYKTLVGGIVFILYIILTFYFVIASFISFINRTTYSQYTIENNLDHAPQMNILDPKMVFAFGLALNKVTNVSAFDNILNITLQHVSINKANKTKERSNIKVTKCNKTEFPSSLHKNYDLLGLDNYFCIDKDYYNNTMYIEGLYSAELFSYIEFSAAVASSMTAEVDKIRNFFYNNEIKMQLYYLESSINISDYNSPEKLYLNGKYIELSYPFFFKLNADFANNTFINDANILLPHETEFKFYSVLGYENLQTFLGDARLDDKYPDHNLFGRMYIRSLNKSIIMKRVYQKFTEFLADATSIVSQLLLILMLILQAYDKFRASECVINRIMHYKEKLMSKTPKEFKVLKDLFRPQFDNLKSQYNTDNKENNKGLSEVYSASLFNEKNKDKQKTMNMGKIQPISSDSKIDDKSSSEFKGMYYIEDSINIQGSGIGSVNGIGIGRNMCNDIPNANFNSPCNGNYNANNITRNQTNAIDNLNQKKNEKYNKELKTMIRPSDMQQTYHLFVINKLHQAYNRTNKLIKSNNKNKLNSKHDRYNDTIKYSFFDFIRLIGLRLGIKSNIQHKEILVDKGVKYFLHNLNIFTYFYKMREIDLIKHFLFDSNEANLINFLSKPSISTLILDETNPLNETQKEFEMTNRNINKLSQSFNDIYKNYQDNNGANEREDKFLKQTAYEVYQLIH